MSDPIEQGARAAAQRLTTTAYANLTHEVEVALHNRGADRRPGQYTDPVALAGLIVSVATLAWTVFNDIRSRNSAAAPAPTPDTVARRVRLELDQADAPAPPLAPADRDRIIATTVEETLRAASESDPDLV
ncbi:hypothetical protein ACFYX8_05195 [Streptomyces cyaneofuscatus]|uniref:hypothetical protein n=1 Tax=Streptomyces TaxID=1883 RepID=UPI000372515C|nr:MULTISPECIES: hypothetical protein [unclassified Streptomyces]MZF52953.1 hypothetical protein [Streptomyces sp. SID5594]